MIHLDKERIEVKGNELQIRAELTMLIKNLIQHGLIKNDDDMSEIYKVAKMSSEEIQKQACDILDSMDIGKALATLMIASGRFDHD